MMHVMQYSPPHPNFIMQLGILQETCLVSSKAHEQNVTRYETLCRQAYLRLGINTHQIVEWQQ